MAYPLHATLLLLLLAAGARSQSYLPPRSWYTPRRSILRRHPSGWPPLEPVRHKMVHPPERHHAGGRVSHAPKCVRVSGATPQCLEP